ncbi:MULTISPECIES: pentapeptide repeat-containing protein [Streptomyces]|uniref:pentapeptide repeat-containing protein n=1 Tax=Streptomyces TaxID=1883 RepID=UPI00081EF0EB|nr:pentapeptide repeat-containing protein [Streptomyces sp. PpalLS-921]SCD80842.1 Uncharacterized protein YjbI, contains pentapeptide repeats [Streptomyces sp. PpalLS-921]
MTPVIPQPPASRHPSRTHEISLSYNVRDKSLPFKGAYNRQIIKAGSENSRITSRTRVASSPSTHVMPIKPRSTTLQPYSQKTAGVIALSGTRSGERSVKTPPADAQATAVLIEWTASGDSPLDAAGLDLRGADLSDADLTEGLFTESVLRDVNLSGSDLYRSHLEGAELEGANLSEATLVKAVLDESSLAGANLDRADLGSVEAWAVDARGASFRSAKLDGAGLLDVKLQGADLSNASVQRTSFQVFMDEQTTVLGLTGTVFGPAHVTEGSELRAITGADLEVWLNSRGAHVQVLPPLRGYGQ